MRVVRNIRVSDEARDYLLRHYMERDVDHPSQLRSMPGFSYVEAYKDAAGNVLKDVIVGYILSKTETDRIMDDVISPFDNGKKFFAIEFRDEFDEYSTYIVEYFDGITYILKE
jgi:hypothetical protein